MLESAEKDRQMISVAITVVLFAFFWALRDKLNTMGLEYVHWKGTPAVWILRAVALGVAVAAATAWLFRGYSMGQQPPFAELWIAVTWGPLIEEIIFRGYIFSFSYMILSRWLRRPGWLIVIGIAALFALSHAIKSGITPVQVISVFVTGTLYGWLRLGSGSAVPAVTAHISYNSVIHLAAAYLRQSG
jgi:membrane protease YdiL (CAAX protease family)